MIGFVGGLGLGLSLIVAIGAQNVFVLRQGIRREHVWIVVLICAASDAILIAIGVAGIGSLLESVPWLIDVARCAGALFLTGYAVLAARRAWRGTEILDVPAERAPAPAAMPPRRLPLVMTTLALTWLNPHVYLDTVLLLGSIAATHGSDRWLFGAGAIVASIGWFTALGFGARYLGRFLRTPRSWRVLDALIAVVMLAIALSLIAPLLGTGSTSR